MWIMGVIGRESRERDDNGRGDGMLIRGENRGNILDRIEDI